MEAELNFAPYGSPENIQRILMRPRSKGLPPRISAEYLAGLGIGEGMIPRNLRTLEFLDFIDGEGTPTKRLQDFVTAGEEDWEPILMDAIREAYDPIFRLVNPEEDTRNAIFTAFRQRKPQSQWGRMVTLFLGLCQLAGMAVKDPPSQRSGKDAPPKQHPSRSKVDQRPRFSAGPLIAPTRSSTPAQSRAHAYPPPRIGLDPALSGIVAKIPELETLDDVERWWIMFRSAFTFVKKL